MRSEPRSLPSPLRHHRRLHPAAAAAAAALGACASRLCCRTVVHGRTADCLHAHRTGAELWTKFNQGEACFVSSWIDRWIDGSMGKLKRVWASCGAACVVKALVLRQTTQRTEGTPCSSSSEGRAQRCARTHSPVLCRVAQLNSKTRFRPRPSSSSSILGLTRGEGNFLKLELELGGELAGLEPQTFLPVSHLTAICCRILVCMITARSCDHHSGTCWQLRECSQTFKRPRS